MLSLLFPVPPATISFDELTPTQKVRRQHVLAKLTDDVEALYAPPTPTGKTPSRRQHIARLGDQGVVA